MPRKATAIAACLLAFGAVAAPAGAAEPAFDPTAWQVRAKERPTEVLVIGSPHLSGAPADFDPAVLEPLLQRLAAFKPDVIAVENLSGESLFALRAYSGVYRDTAQDYGGRFYRLATMAWAGTGLDLPAAEAEARRLLREWPAAPSPAQRRRLAAVFAASGDPHSALVQWWRLDPAERKAADGITSDLAAALNEYDARRNESHMIGSRLAVRLGLERVHPTDDHAADDVVYARLDEIMAYFETPELKAVVQGPGIQRFAKAAERMRTPEEALATYRWLNTAEAGREDAELQWGLMPGGPDAARRRFAEWEARNLRMVAHIREAAAEAPGGRVLVIVGSSHKPWFDAYLSMMADMKVVDAQTVLK